MSLPKFYEVVESFIQFYANIILLTGKSSEHLWTRGMAVFIIIVEAIRYIWISFSFSNESLMKSEQWRSTATQNSQELKNIKLKLNKS